MTIARIILSAFLVLFPDLHSALPTVPFPAIVTRHWGRRLRGRARIALEQRAQLIAAAAARHHVSPLLVVSLCWMESGLRVRNRGASLCGCQPYDTSDATQAECAARAIRAGLDRCGDVDAAVARYVWGRCTVTGGVSQIQQRWRAHVKRYQRLRAWAEAGLLNALHPAL